MHPVWFSCLLLIWFCVSNEQADAAKALSLDSLFPSDRVIEVEVRIDEKDWDQLRYQTRDRGAIWERQFGPMESPFSYFDAQVTIDGVAFPNVGLRKKGFIGSLSDTRPSLKVKLNHKLKGGNLGGLTTLTFNNNRQDTGLVSQYMTYAMFNRVGSPAPRCAFARVTVNGRNLGVYSHVETVRKPLLLREFGTDQGTLYEGTAVDFEPGWEKSLELKTGADEPGRKKIIEITQALQGSGRYIVSSEAKAKAWVPRNGDDQQRWMNPDFDDSEWITGVNGMGYEMQRGYEAFIHDPFDFGTLMHNRCSSAYLRLPFEVRNLDLLKAEGVLTLRMRFDDGFVAYLNGERIASANAPKSLRWNGAATDSHEASGAMVAFPISDHADKLREGRNVLAVQGFNNSVSSSDMLITAGLQLETNSKLEALAEHVDFDSFYKFWAVEGLLGFWDGYSGNRNNYFVYLNPKTDKMHFLPWGADSLFTNESRIHRDTGRPKSVKTRGALAEHLWRYKSERDRYGRTISGILEDFWDESVIIDEMDRFAALLRPYVGSEQLRFDWKLAEMRRFVLHRRAEVMSEVRNDFRVEQ